MSTKTKKRHADTKRHYAWRLGKKVIQVWVSDDEYREIKKISEGPVATFVHALIQIRINGTT